MTDSQLILSEIRDLRRDFTTFSLDITSRIAALEQSNKNLQGNGQPGRVTILESKVDFLEKDRDERIGAKKRDRYWHAAISSVAATLVTVVFKYSGVLPR